MIIFSRLVEDNTALHLALPLHHNANASPHFCDILPKALKGVDLGVYSLFKNFGMHGRARPVFNKGSVSRGPALAPAPQLREEDYQEILSSPPIDTSDLDLDWKFILFSRRLEGFGRVCTYAKQNNLQVNLHDSSKGCLIRTDLKPFRCSHRSEEWDAIHEVGGI